MRLTDNVRLTSGITVATPSMRKHMIAKRVNRSCISHVTNDATRTEMPSAPVSDNSIFLDESVMRGHHIFKGIWTPRTEEIVQVRQEAGKPHDRNACRLSSKPMERWLDMCLALSCWVLLDSKAFWRCLGHSNDSVLFRVPIVTSHTCSSRSIRFKAHALNKPGLVTVIMYALM